MWSMEWFIDLKYLEYETLETSRTGKLSGCRWRAAYRYSNWCTGAYIRLTSSRQYLTKEANQLLRNEVVQCKNDDLF